MSYRWACEDAERSIDWCDEYWYLRYDYDELKETVCSKSEKARDLLHDLLIYAENHGWEFEHKKLFEIASEIDDILQELMEVCEE